MLIFEARHPVVMT